jgi:hypothetical protein
MLEEMTHQVSSGSAVRLTLELSSPKRSTVLVLDVASWYPWNQETGSTTLYTRYVSEDAC